MGKHDKTLADLFELPTRADVRWTAVKALITSLGGKVDDRRAGSRVGLLLNGVKGLVHSPHPGDVMKRSSVKAVRDFLSHAGFKP